jgi:hypothetical protein
VADRTKHVEERIMPVATPAVESNFSETTTEWERKSQSFDAMATDGVIHGLGVIVRSGIGVLVKSGVGVFVRSGVGVSVRSGVGVSV